MEYFGDRSQDPGGYCVELGYYFGVNALEQTFATTPGQQYVVSFHLSTDAFNGPPARLRVTAGGDSADFQAPPGTLSMEAMGWQPQTFRFTAEGGGSTTLWFGKLAGIPAIDTVSVTPIPEPGTAGLFCFGGAATALTSRRRRRRL